MTPLCCIFKLVKLQKGLKCNDTLQSGLQTFEAVKSISAHTQEILCLMCLDIEKCSNDSCWVELYVSLVFELFCILVLSRLYRQGDFRTHRCWALVLPLKRSCKAHHQTKDVRSWSVSRLWGSRCWLDKQMTHPSWGSIQWCNSCTARVVELWNETFGSMQFQPDCMTKSKGERECIVEFQMCNLMSRCNWTNDFSRYINHLLSRHTSCRAVCCGKLQIFAYPQSQTASCSLLSVTLHLFCNSLIYDLLQITAN